MSLKLEQGALQAIPSTVDSIPPLLFTQRRWCSQRRNLRQRTGKNGAAFRASRRRVPRREPAAISLSIVRYSDQTNHLQGRRWIGGVFAENDGYRFP